MRPRIALATCDAFPALCDDDRALLPALAACGLEAEIRDWRAPVDWARYDAVLLRSTWDYFERPAEFLAWIAALERTGVRCFNEPALVRWNADKRYLRELAAKGVATVPTLWFEAGPGVTSPAVADRVAAEGWDDVVLKPAVSGGAWRTHRMRRAELSGAGAVLDEILRASALLVQPFLPEVVADGEHSLLFFDGAFSHAALKRAKPGDYRVQWTHGGTQVPETVPDALVTQARAVLDAAPSPGLYARVDGIVRDGRFVLMELEQIEPYLFFAQAPEAPGRLARALTARL